MNLESESIKTKYTKQKNIKSNNNNSKTNESELDLPITKETIISSSFDSEFNINPINIEKSQSYYYKKIGKTYTFFGDKDGNPLLIIGPQYPLFIFFMILLSFFYFGVLSFFWKNISISVKIVLIIIYIIYFISYVYTAIINPGYPKHNLDSRTGEPKNKYKFCNICKMYVNKEKLTFHCEECHICIEGRDHHCAWCGKCIGKRNLCSFYIWLFSLVGLIFAMMIGMVNAEMNVKAK
jgi:hypothetical protein